MKRFTLVFIFFSLALTLSAQEFGQDKADFAVKFNKAVMSHKKSKVIKCTDKKYRKEQIKFLGGNKQQFVDELFGGYDTQTKEYVSLKLNEIDTIEVKQVESYEFRAWNYVFHLKSGDRTIEVSLDLLLRKGKYGFVGAVG